MVELVMVVAMLAILMTLAVPGYQEYRYRAHRMVAITHLLQLATCQERIKAQSGHYDTTRCIPGADGAYDFEIVPTGSVNSAAFTARAVPVSSQQNDRCGWLILEHNGNRSVEHAEIGSNPCWAGR